MSDYIWVVNKGVSDYDKIDTDLKRHLILKPMRPIQLPRSVAMKYIGKQNIFACENPDHYFQGQPLKRLVIRDAGIGDLLLLEPLLRQIGKNGHSVDILTRFADVCSLIIICSHLNILLHLKFLE